MEIVSSFAGIPTKPAVHGMTVFMSLRTFRFNLEAQQKSDISGCFPIAVKIAKEQIVLKFRHHHLCLVV